MTKYTIAIDAIRATISSSEYSNLWQADVVEDVTSTYLQQVQALVETARQMDSALMRRAKGGAPSSAKGGSSGSGNMSDSEKIASQMIFDIRAFEQAVRGVGISDPFSIASFGNLHAQIAEMKKLFENLNA